MTLWSPPNVIHTGPTEARISVRQARVLDGMYLGLTNAQIGRRMYLSEDTVKNHARYLCDALGARNRAHAVSLAVAGLVVIEVEER